MKFSVPITFAACCRVYVDANNAHEAIRKAMEEYNNPDKLDACMPSYLEDSIRPAYGVDTVNDVHLVS